MIASASIQLKQPKDAEQAARDAIRISGGTPPCWIWLGSALQQQGRPFEAVDAFIEAGDLETQLAPVHHVVMTALALVRQYDRAISVIDRWLTGKQSQAGNIVGERRRIGLLLYKAGMLAQAIDFPRHRRSWSRSQAVSRR
jgi:tetratricopeptide (TPR) repeat protein